MSIDPLHNPTDNFKLDEIIYSGLLSARLRVVDSTKFPCQILIHGQEECFRRNGNTDLQYQDRCRELLDTVLFKLKSTTLITEQLHAIRNTKDYRIPPEFVSKVEGDIYDGFLHRTLFDYALLQMQSLMEMYLRYIAYFCDQKDTTNISIYEVLESLGVSKNFIAKKMYCFLRSEVYNPEWKQKKYFWGDLLANIRNTTAHEKQIILSKLDIVNCFGHSRTEISYDGQLISRFTQNVIENILYMLRSGFTILYGMNWDYVRKEIIQN